MTVEISASRRATVDKLAQLRPNERAALADYLARLEKKFADRIRHVILYGSRARGEGDDESDLDLLVVVEDDGDPVSEDEVALISFEPSLEYDALISPHIWSMDHYIWHSETRLLFFRNLERDGVDLWTPSVN